MYENPEEKYDIDEAIHVGNIFKLVFELLESAIMTGGNSLTYNYDIYWKICPFKMLGRSNFNAWISVVYFLHKVNSFFLFVIWGRVC